jgi:phage-related protein
MAGWTIEDYRTPAGHSLLRQFLDGLENQQDRKEAAALIKVLQIRGNLLREPLSEALGEGLFELRGDQVRIFYTFRPGRRIVLLHRLVKKRGNVPPAILRRMRAMQKQVT